MQGEGFDAFLKGGEHKAVREEHHSPPNIDDKYYQPEQPLHTTNHAGGDGKGGKKEQPDCIRVL